MLSVLVLTACASSPGMASRQAGLTAGTSCHDPAAYGAIAGDEGSDRLAIQAAIDAAAAGPDGGTVCIGPGRFRLERAPVGTYDRFAALYVGARPAYETTPAMIGHHVTIRGAGPATVLEIAGDQLGSTTILFDVLPGAEGIAIEDLTLDLTGTDNTAEQTHAIATSGTCADPACLPIRDLAIRNVTFRHPRNTTARKGDCVRLLGNTEATRLYGARISGCHFEACARSAVEIQRGVYDLVIDGNPVIRAGKTCIDGEATGGVTDTDARIAIVGNTFADCSTAISLTSTRDATITGNLIVGNVTVYRSTMVAITGNTIDHVATDNAGTIDVSNVCDGLVISGNAVIRSGVTGPLLKLEPHSGGICQHVAIAGNTLTNNTPAWVISMMSVSHAAITSNHMAIGVAAPGMSVIYDRSVLAASPVVGLAITGNVLSGFGSYAVRLQAQPGTFGAGIVVSGNAAAGPVFGMQLSNPAGFTMPITAGGNAMGPGVYGSVQVVHGD